MPLQDLPEKRIDRIFALRDAIVGVLESLVDDNGDRLIPKVIERPRQNSDDRKQAELLKSVDPVTGKMLTRAAIVSVEGFSDEVVTTVQTQMVVTFKVRFAFDFLDQRYDADGAEIPPGELNSNSHDDFWRAVLEASEALNRNRSLGYRGVEHDLLQATSDATLTAEVRGDKFVITGHVLDATLDVVVNGD